MGKSLIQDEQECYLCGRTTGLEKHHIFAGHANRPISERIGAYCFLCHDCHTGKNGAQYDADRNKRLKQDAQRAFEKDHTREEWMKLIRKNYLEEEDEDA